ncbi:VF530 family DNA-binding protein [Aurantibacter sp.]|uniref:VF530 family protein n=1 Tax=Aurantibacter sp. TaxID=2807103 RepID=UPI0035C85B60
MTQINNPLHGIKLADIVTELHEFYGWEYLGHELNMNCFKSNPTIKSSLKFLRRTPWARTKVENFYLKFLKKNKR